MRHVSFARFLKHAFMEPITLHERLARQIVATYAIKNNVKARDVAHNEELISILLTDAELQQHLHAMGTTLTEFFERPRVIKRLADNVYRLQHIIKREEEEEEDEVTDVESGVEATPRKSRRTDEFVVTPPKSDVTETRLLRSRRTSAVAGPSSAPLTLVEKYEPKASKYVVMSFRGDDEGTKYAKAFTSQAAETGVPVAHVNFTDMFNIGADINAAHTDALALCFIKKCIETGVSEFGHFDESNVAQAISIFNGDHCSPRRIQQYLWPRPTDAFNGSNFDSIVLRKPYWWFVLVNGMDYKPLHQALDKIEGYPMIIIWTRAPTSGPNHAPYFVVSTSQGDFDRLGVAGKSLPKSAVEQFIKPVGDTTLFERVGNRDMEDMRQMCSKWLQERIELYGAASARPVYRTGALEGISDLPMHELFEQAGISCCFIPDIFVPSLSLIEHFVDAFVDKIDEKDQVFYVIFQAPTVPPPTMSQVAKMLEGYEVEYVVTCPDGYYSRKPRQRPHIKFNAHSFFIIEARAS